MVPMLQNEHFQTPYVFVQFVKSVRKNVQPVTGPAPLHNSPGIGPTLLCKEFIQLFVEFSNCGGKSKSQCTFLVSFRKKSRKLA